MYIKYDHTVKLGERLIAIHKFIPEFMVRNKLSPKPQKAANKLKEIVECPKSIVKDYDVSMKQDYHNSTVILNLLSQCLVFEAGGGYAKGTNQGQSIVRSTVLPATAAVKRYTKALKDMVEKPFEEDIVQTQISKPKKQWYQFWK